MASSKSFDDTSVLLFPTRGAQMNPRSSTAPTPKLEQEEDISYIRRSSTSRPVLRHHYLTLPRSTDIVTHQPPHEETKEKEFFKSEGLSSQEASELLKKWGPNELESKRTPKWMILLSQFTAPMPIMIWIAIIVEGAIENYSDMGILLAIQLINGFLGFYETTRAGDAVEALKASMKPEAVVKRDGKFQKMNACDIVPGDLVLLGSGAAVPADCVVNHGQIDVDQSALTGESLPVTLYAGDAAKMGSTVTRGEVEATVEQTGKNTFFGKTASLLQADTGMGNLQRLLLKIMVVLVVISVLLCVTAFGYLLGEKESLKSALSFTVVLLVASIPVAIEIVVTTTLAMGSRELSKHGAIVTRLAAIEDMAGMKILCSDKTGTLTLNKMVLMENTPVYIDGEDQKSVLVYASMAAKWKEPPRDALDTLVLSSVDMKRLENYQQIDYMPFDPTIKRTEGTTKLPNGTIVKTTKGAPNILLKLITDENIKKRVEKDVSELGKSGIRSLAVARCQGTEDWRMVGLLTFQDPPRPDTKETIEKAAEFGVEVKMITGDHLLIAKETARTLGMGTDIYDPTMLPSLQGEELTNPPKDLGAKYGEQILRASGFAQVFPEHKFLVVETLRQMGYKVGMTGDGVNDAPALKRADVGVAVQGATDAARSSADIVLTQPGLSTIVHGLMISRQIFQRIKNFLTYRIAATLQLLTFFFIAVFALHPIDYVPKPRPSNFIGPDDWPYFFELPVLMLMLITLLNDGTLISIGYDHVNPSKHPDKWNLKVLFVIAGVLGSVACGSSLLLLWAALDSWNPKGLFHGMGISGLGYGQVITTMYLKVSISDFLTLFSSRTTDGFFWTVKPSLILLVAATVAMSTSTILACLWPDSAPHGIQTEGLTRATPKLMALWVWIYCIIVWLFQDALKVLVYYLMERYNIFDINGTLVQSHSLKSVVTDRGPSVESNDRLVDHTIPVTRQVQSPHTPNPTPTNYNNGR